MISFSWSNPQGGETIEEVGRLDRVGKVSVDGVEVPLSAVRLGQQATIIARPKIDSRLPLLMPSVTQMEPR